MRWFLDGAPYQLTGLLLGALLVIGCGGDEPKPESAGAEEASAEKSAADKPAEGQAAADKEAAAEAAADEPKDKEPQKSLADLAREELAATFTELYCAQRNNTDADLLAVYKKRGYDSPAAWNKAWDKAAKRKPDWARKVVNDAMASDCTPAAPAEAAGDSKK